VVRENPTLMLGGCARGLWLGRREWGYTDASRHRFFSLKEKSRLRKMELAQTSEPGEPGVGA